MVNEEAGRDGTGATTAGEVRVLLVDDDARVDTRGNDGVPVAKQTAEIKEGKSRDSPRDDA